MSTAETAGSVAGTAIDAFRSTPALLAIMLLNAMFIGFNTYTSVNDDNNKTAQFTTIVERCLPSPLNAIMNASK